MSSKKRQTLILLSLMLYAILFITISPINSDTEDRLNISDDRPKISNGGYGYNASLGIMICIDVSSSMTPEMIQETQDAAYLILDIFSNDTYVGLVTYARYSYVNVSLNVLGEGTQEDDLKDSIDSLAPLPYTNIFGGLMDCIEEFEGSTFESKHIILMTDGYPNIADPGYEQFGGENIVPWESDLDSPALIANESNICIQTIGFGSNFYQELLETISNITACGEFYDASESNELAMAFANIGNKVEGWVNEETYYGSISDEEMVNITRYFIDDRYPFVRIWLTWENPDNYTLTLIIKDHNGANMTAFDTGGSNPPFYGVFNCTDINYIDIFVYGELVNASTLDITSWGNNIASNEEYEIYTAEEKDTTFSGDCGIIFCIDVSVSMDPTMVEQTKKTIHLILDLISNDTYIGLVTFARYSYVNVSLNRINNGTQADDIESAIDSMVAMPYTNIYGGLTACIEEFEGFSFSSKYIILMSDGIANIADPGYEQFGCEDVSTWTTDLNSPVLIANDSDICIFTISYGDKHNEILLEAIAENTNSNISNGEYYDDREYNALVMTFARLEGWQTQETYNGAVAESETVEIRRYNIDDRYPIIRIWLYWNEDEDCDLDIIVKDHNGYNMTSFDNGGQNPPSYMVFNCTSTDYIDIFIYGEMVNTPTLNISYICSIESLDIYESSINEVLISEEGVETISSDLDPFYLIMIILVACTIILCGEHYIKNKKKKKKSIKSPLIQKELNNAASVI